MDIRIAETDEDILAVFTVMQHLRELSDAASFLERVRHLQTSGYLLAFVSDADEAVAAAGFRIGENLPWGRHLYVDDLITLPEKRGKGCGGALLRWLADHARSEGCAQIHLDSANWRMEAHRFYEREGMDGSSTHFWRPL